MSAPRPLTAPDAPGRERDAHLDNAKAVLIALVVVGHVLELIKGPAADTLYTFIYTFHMPAFVFLCGHFARRFRLDGRHARALVTDLVIPYLVFNCVTCLVASWSASHWVSFSPLEPTGVMWFLLALGVWRLTAPIWRAMWPTAALAIALAVALIAPLDSHTGATLSVGRIAGLLPFFVAGLIVPPRALAALRRPGWRVAGWAVLAGLFVLARTVLQDWPRSCFYMDHPYPADWSWLHGMAVRAAILALAGCGIVAVLAVVPWRRCALSGIGRHSMEVYLLHFPVVLAARDIRVLGPFLTTAQPWWLVACAVVAALAFAALLGAEPVARRLQLVTRPAWVAHLLFRR
ncbi:MAG: acyltransferase family protein [Bifidobacteriaceae bacterium]|jgi:fucose 4-O-acetylase-like acetyltransferase|nr:acyltransferase family protein [Bifidobacteriaceae bacterium]